MTPAQAKMVAQKLGDGCRVCDDVVLDAADIPLYADQVIGRLMDVWAAEDKYPALINDEDGWACYTPASNDPHSFPTRIEAVLALLEKLV